MIGDDIVRGTNAPRPFGELCGEPSICGRRWYIRRVGEGCTVDELCVVTPKISASEQTTRDLTGNARSERGSACAGPAATSGGVGSDDRVGNWCSQIRSDQRR